MKFRIYGTGETGIEDSVIVSGETIEELQDAAASEVKKRGWKHPWSEPVE